MLSHWDYKLPSYCQKCESFTGCILPLCLSVKRLQPAAHVALSVQTPRAVKLHYHREGIRYTDAPETTQFTKHLKAFQPMSYYWQNLKNTGESQFVLFLWVPKFKAELCHLWYQHDQKLLLQTGFSNSKMLGFGRKKKHFPIPFHFLNKGIDF